MENIENLESVKSRSMIETNLKKGLIMNNQGSHDKEFLLIFYRSLQFVCKLKNQHRSNDFPHFP